MNRVSVWMSYSPRNRSKSAGWFRVRIGTEQGLLQWVLPFKKEKITESAVFCPVPQFCDVTPLAPIQLLPSDPITICNIHAWWRYACSITSCSPIGDPINIRWVTAKNVQFLPLFHTSPTYLEQIANWWKGSGSACKTGTLTPVSYSVMIRSHTMNWSQCSEYVKMRICCMQNKAKKPWFVVQVGI